MENVGIEPTTPCLQSRCSPSWANPPYVWQVYSRHIWWVWMDSNHRPPPYQDGALTNWATDPYIVKSFWCRFGLTTDKCECLQIRCISRKEVIQPHLPIRLPCYDFTPVMNTTVVSVLPKVRLPTSGKTHSHGVTGGVYKARERIHRDLLIRDY